MASGATAVSSSAMPLSPLGPVGPSTGPAVGPMTHQQRKLLPSGLHLPMVSNCLSHTYNPINSLSGGTHQQRTVTALSADVSNQQGGIFFDEGFRVSGGGPRAAARP